MADNPEKILKEAKANRKKQTMTDVEMEELRKNVEKIILRREKEEKEEFMRAEMERLYELRQYA